MWFILIVNVRGQELSPWRFTSVVFIFGAILVERVPFQFEVRDRMWNSIVSVPNHCLLSTQLYTMQNIFSNFLCFAFLAHLSRRLIGELIV